MTREEQLSEKRAQIDAIKKQISKLEKKHAARLSRRKPTNNMFIQLRRISKDIETILSVRGLAIQAYCIQSQPIAHEFEKGGMIEAKEREKIIIPNVPPEQREHRSFP